MSFNIESYDILLLMIPGMIAFGYLDIRVLGQRAKNGNGLHTPLHWGVYAIF